VIRETYPAFQEGAGDAIYGLRFDPLDGSDLDDASCWSSAYRSRVTPDQVSFYATGVSGKVKKHYLTRSGDMRFDILYQTEDPYV
jgi:hypothetical protein